MPNNAFTRMLGDDQVVLPDVPTDQVQLGLGNPLTELGVTGIKRAAGIIDEEFLPALRGRKAVQVFREMSLNDPMVGALLFTITQLLRQVTWRVEGADSSPESTKAADFVESCMEDMSHTWDDMITEVLSCMTYGWSWHEVVYKRRVGPYENDPAKRSKYTDGLIGWRKIPIRAQETMLRWVFDEKGGIKAMVQLAPPQYQTTLIPIEKSLLFRFTQAKGNPEGVSLLRTAYRPWFFKKRLEEFEAIGVERDLAGLPVARVPADYMKAIPNSEQGRVFAAFKKLVSNVRRDEHEGLVLPSQFDRDTKQQMFEFELMSAGGSRQFDTNAIIQRYEQRILMTVLADFIMVGHEGNGSYALHVDKTGIFRAALNSIAQMIADVFNRYAIPPLFKVNGWQLPELPKIVPNNVDPPDLTQLSQFMTAMGNLGMEWFPDPQLEAFLRETAHLPELPDDMMELRQAMATQHAVAGYAASQMELLGAQQKAQMTAQGYSPEQAQMMSETPTADHVAAQTQAQYAGQARAAQDPEVQAGQQMEADQAMAQQGDPVGDHTATAQVDEQRAQGDHQRTIEQAQLQESREQAQHARALQLAREQAKGKTREDQLATRDTSRQIQLERIRQKGQADKTKGDIARIKAQPKPTASVSKPKGKLVPKKKG